MFHILESDFEESYSKSAISFHRITSHKPHRTHGWPSLNAGYACATTLREHQKIIVGEIDDKTHDIALYMFFPEPASLVWINGED